MLAKIFFSGGQKLLSEIKTLMILRILSMMDGKTTAPLKGLIAKLSSVPNAKKGKSCDFLKEMTG